MNLGVVGLGYVGLPLAVAFAKKYNVTGFDINEKKIQNYIHNNDVTNEVGNEKLKKTNIKFTSDEKEIKELDFIIIAVPTPVNSYNIPDFNPLESASMIVARNMKKGTIVVYESTVYPGATEEKCIPILEKYSKLICGKDFKVGYSPERINPGDKEHKLENIVKIISAVDNDALDKIEKVYSSIINAGVIKVSSIKTAEASKIIENTQRDINIAFMNEIAILFEKLGINTEEVLKAASTKWNFLNFKPGLVGGHCIGVDPYYLIAKGDSVNCNMKLVKAARQINDYMPQYIVKNILDKLYEKQTNDKEIKIAVLGVTFKENVSDTRNSKALEIVKLLDKKGIKVIVSDSRLQEEIGYINTPIKDIKNVDAVIVAVAHDEYKNMNMSEIKVMFKEKRNIVYDLKNVFSEEEAIKEKIEKINL